MHNPHKKTDNQRALSTDILFANHDHLLTIVCLRINEKLPMIQMSLHRYFLYVPNIRNFY